MEIEVKQRNRRRKRAQRMQQQLKETKACKANPDESEAEDVIPKKPPRPPNRRKKQKDQLKEPLCEEDIIDGFSILQFRSYDDLELVLKISVKENIKRLTEIERPKLEPKAHITNHILVHNNHGLTLTHDPATSDDSGRASERLTGSSLAPRDADSSRDRLSDASSRCSSGKGYICDSEGEDDKGSDASSVIFASTPASRKHEFPGALPPSLPHGTSNSPVPAPTPPNVPVPSPAPAQQPPNHPPQAIPSAAVSSATAAGIPVEKVEGMKPNQEPIIPTQQPAPPTIISQPVAAMPNVPTPVTIPQPAAAPMAHHPPALESSIHPGGHAMRTDSPAVATSANAAVAPSPGQYHHSYQPAYAPYAHTTTPYTTSNSVTTTVPPPIVSSGPPLQPIVTSGTHVEREKHMRPPTPVRARSPARENRERESYSSVSSLSRSSVPTTAHSHVPPTTTMANQSGAPVKPWPAASQPPTTQLSPAPPRPTPPLHTASTYPAPAPLFAPPVAPPPASTASPLTTAPANPNPFSAESLFQTNQADMLRRELDNRFLASQDRSLGVAPPPYLRTEMHQHQHHHTHVHQHTTSLLPPPAGSTLFPSQLSMSPMERLARRTQSSFKDIPKLGGVDSPFYRQNIGIPNYPGYPSSLISHPGLTAGPTPFMPPNHLTTFQPKSVTPQDPTKPKVMKTGKWNAMHVRVAWEIYHHQQKSGEAKGSITATKTPSDLLRPPTHMFSPSVHTTRAPHEISPFPPLSHRPAGFDQPHHPGSLFTTPSSHLGKSPFTSASSMSPFTRYGGAPLTGPTPSPFSVSPFGASRESHLGLGPLHHDPWRSLQRTVPGFPPSVNPLPPTLPGLPPPGPAPWTIKPDPVLEQREREAREREERERERLRREREERERREREEKQRRLEQQQQQERERERREKERREMERREMEKREREREMLLHQQRLAETAKQQIPPPVIRERSPLRNGQADLSEIRVKEEPRTKEEDLSRTADPRYHPYLRHPTNLQPPPPSMLDRTRMLHHGLPPHYPSAASHWPPPADPFYRYGYNPLVVDAMRAQEERDRANFFGAYVHPSHHPSQLRPKDPSLLHLRGGPGPPGSVHKMSLTPPTDLHKKEEPR